jgi:hypothetical protein
MIEHGKLLAGCSRRYCVLLHIGNAPKIDSQNLSDLEQTLFLHNATSLPAWHASLCRKCQEAQIVVLIIGDVERNVLIDIHDDVGATSKISQH